ncbi:serine/threonine protein kinase [Coemansia sp. RSA 1813]|nr:serine/threonine protein kinase [Coemansia sp. RSA 1646]KAJ1770519.1 serine/threonine protein kinase [Coemansia sp. RSA 1843]KAJ2092944.1 serine/threonine protein kinase [Coemansia sp. RSA 986]KAJ2216265.1 serine/threonine protein kinase [Coemansia sp. RSA 487]KAJ2570563.1 serine/threonine protein kinase [Coemansia sp. RSA 1813]
MGILNVSHKKSDSDHHHHHHLLDDILPNHALHHPAADHGAQTSPQNISALPPLPPAAGSTHAAKADSSVPQKVSRHNSLRVRTDSANQPTTPHPPHPMTAGAEPPSPYRDAHNNSPFSHAPASTAVAAKHSANGSPVSSNPMTIKRNTSFSQRLHNFLHRDKLSKHVAPAAAPVQSLRHGGASGHETPTIAYRTPTTQTHSADTSANPSAAASTNNSPPASLTPRDSSTNLTKDSKAAAAAAAEPTAYRAQRNFEPVHEDKVFEFSNVGLRSVQRHNDQIQQFMSKDICQSHDQTVPHQQSSAAAHNAAADGIAHELQQTSIEPASTNTVSRGASSHSVSREPSQNTLHHHGQPSSNDNIHNTAAATAAATSASAHPPAIGSAAPAASEAEKTGQEQKLKQNGRRRLSDESGLAGVTVKSERPSAEDIAATRERLAAGTTRDPTIHSTNGEDSGGGDATCAHEDRLDKPCPSLPHKKQAPVYSSHKASLHQFGKQTKVIGKGTGGTVRLLQGTDVNMRPQSLRSGPPSSQNGGDAAENNVYVPSQHKLFAVKEFRKKRPDETPRSYMKKVTSEFCIGSSVHQENVIETLDLIFEGDRVYEIMEFCPHDLFAFVVKGSMDLDETFCWFKQICRGVQYLHKIGIAHRDLKLENCLLTDKGVVKIIDFGCATVYKTPFQKEPSKVVGFCGSDPYIAPEVVQSHRQLPYYAQVADIWSVGIMYMCMTLLKFPWRIADTEADRNYGSYIRDWPRGRDKLFAQLPKLRHDGQDVIQGMMYPEVKGRFTMDQVMESVWMKEIDVCHTGMPSKTHTHDMKPE